MVKAELLEYKVKGNLKELLVRMDIIQLQWLWLKQQKKVDGELQDLF